MISILVDVCKNIFDFLLKEKEIDNENKKHISKTLNDISLILLDTAEKFKNNEYPHGNCVIMENLSVELCDKIKGYLTQENIDKLSNSLKEVCFLEKMFAERNEETIISLEKASGEFKSMSIIVSL